MTCSSNFAAFFIKSPRSKGKSKGVFDRDFRNCRFKILDENMSSWSSGASVLDLIFPQPETVSEIRFRNWYTARLSLLVRFDDSAQAPPKRERLASAAAALSFRRV